VSNILKYGFIDTLTKEEVEKVSGLVDLFHEYWVHRGFYCPETGFAVNVDTPIDFYTIGGVTYIDGLAGLDGYYNYSKAVNPTLKEYFGWLYDIVFDKLEKEIGPCELIDELAHPGFHIFGHQPGRHTYSHTIQYVTRPLATIHYDLQQNKHLKIWEQFKECDLENCLSFTLCIEIPTSGGGLNTWYEPSLKQYEPRNPYTLEVRNMDYEDLGSPTAVVQYQQGKMFYFIGKLLHQMAPAAQSLSSKERRITLQGHGVKCDGVWKIYF
jgi:hypothetical protein